MAKEIGNSNLIDTWASDGPIVDPDISKKEEGWQLGEQPPHEWMNWLQNTFGQKINNILSGGIGEWNAEDEQVAGVFKRHNGKVWRAVNTTTNSEPSDANANWEAIDLSSSIRLSEPIDQVPDAETVQDALAALGALGTNFATDAEAQALESLTKILTPGRLDDAFKGANQLMAGNGYQRLPGGLMLQWIEVEVSNSTPSQVFALPTTFFAQLGGRNSRTLAGHFNSGAAGDGPFLVSSFGESLSSVRVTKNTTGIGASSGVVVVYALGRWK